MTPALEAASHCHTPLTHRPWKNGLAISALWASLLAPGVFAAQAAGTGNVCFYEHTNYQGRELCVNTGSANLMSGLWNDLISSVRLQPGFRVDLFEHADAAGKALTLQASAPDLIRLNFNDMASSYKVSTSTPIATTGPGFTVNGMRFSANACAAEGGRCNFTGSSSVAYGASGQFSVKAATGGVACTSEVFGDPLYGIGKACYLQLGTPFLAPTLAQTPAAAPTPAPAPAPAPAPTPAPAPMAVVPAAKTDAARLLIQATYGPNLAEINRAAAMGPAAWISDQFSTPSRDTHWNYVVVRKGPIGCTVCDSNFINATMESFWDQAVRGPDQLRQRTVLALSEIFVVSTVNSAVEIQEDAHASYLDMLARNAFGNFRTLLEQVSTHPTMGKYLSHLKNEKEDLATGRIPDENYAREVMQLFAIGLWQLNPDGSRKKDGSGRDIPTFSQADVMGMAKVFTGWTFNNGDRSDDKWYWGGAAYKEQMVNFPRFHSSSEKRFLGVVVPANTSGEQSLKVAMDTLFNHPNVGPFIGSQLIKRFVTSNPSPAYIARVTAAFNGSNGVRGDMKAVLTAVLMDPEARDSTKANDPQWGKLREPLVRFGTWMRAFDAKSARGIYGIWNLEDPVSSIGQNPLRAPSVFNWFRPGYAPPGEIIKRGLVAPEFQITHETTVTGYANFISNTVERGYGWNDTNVKSSYTTELALASHPAAMLDHLNLLLLAGRMSATTRQTILDAVNAWPASDPKNRVYTAITLVMVSPEFIVQK